MPHKNLQSALVGARQTLDTAKFGLEDFLRGDSPERRDAGLANAITWGRTVSQSLQNLKTFVNRDEFARWYAPWQAKLQTDEGFQYIYDLRNQVLKEGFLIGLRSAEMTISMNTKDLKPILDHPPPGANGFFVGDLHGGSGWEIKSADGSKSRYYVQLPDTVKLTFETKFSEPTAGTHKPAPSEPIDRLLSRYISLLNEMVQSAQKTFNGSG